jgi:hypothetical protein
LNVHDDDQLVIPNTLTVEQSSEGARVRIAGQAQYVPIPGVKREEADSLIAALHCRPAAIELPSASAVAAETCERFVNLGFGRFVFAPASLERLESQAHAAEIVRFAGSPYELVRNYWRNVGELNQEIGRSLAISRSSAAFLDWLRTLHVQLLMGNDLRTFYCPSSPLARRHAEPGALYHTPSRTLMTRSGQFLLDGPRVNASTIGGPRYHALLDRSLGLQVKAGGSRAFGSSEINWGNLVVGRSRAETQSREWYLPPRPIVDGHWDALFRAWASALESIERQDAAGGTAHLGRFHWYFVHLHPFTCANQSLAFAIVNWGLNRLVGSGIPHLILDQLALRHDCTDHGRLFARAVSNWTTNESEPAVRHMSRVQKRQTLDEFMAQLGAAANADESDAQKVLERHMESARLALLLDGTA